MTIEAVFLDAGGVLLLPNADAILHELAAAGVEADPARLARAHYAGMRATDDDRDREPTWQPYNHAYVAELGVPAELVGVARKAVDRAFATSEWVVPIESSVEALRRLADSDVHLAIVSNSDGSVERLLRDAKICQVGIGDGVDCVAVIDSHLVGIAKPDPEIFHHALEKVGVAADRALHIGDSVRFDVEGARAAGVRPLHLDPFALCPDDTHEHIPDLNAVLEMLT